MKGLKSYLFFMWNYFTPEHCNKIFKETHNPDYIFNEIWVERARMHPDTFWSLLDSTAQERVFEYAVTFMENKI